MLVRRWASFSARGGGFGARHRSLVANPMYSLASPSPFPPACRFFSRSLPSTASPPLPFPSPISDSSLNTNNISFNKNCNNITNSTSSISATPGGTNNSTTIRSSSGSPDPLATITSRLNPAQRAAVLAPSPGISVCLAGPGSGKTRVLAHRVAYLCAPCGLQVQPSAVLALTFTNKAGQEMKTRIAAMLNTTAGLSGEGGQISVGTFHSFCTRLLRTYGSEVLRELTDDSGNGGNSSTLDWDFTIYDRDDSLRVIKTLLQDKKMDSLMPKDVLQLIARRKTKDALDLAAIRSRTFNHSHGAPVVWPSASSSPSNISSLPPSPPSKPFAGLHSSMVFKPELEVLYRDYTAALRANNALDFDDLLLLGWRLLRDYPAVRRKVQKRYQHVLVDEYQDTNHPQYEIIRLLYCDQYQYKHRPENRHIPSIHNTDMPPSPSSKFAGPAAPSDRTLFVVGDANQAIYSWRGALPGNMNRLRADYPSLASLYGLRENYRCSPPIAAVANALLGSEVTTSAAASTGNDSSAPPPAHQPVQVVATKNDAQQAQVIAQLLQSHAGEGKSRAVLYRTNAQSRQLETALMDAQIMYRIIGGLKFYERREVKDVLGYLRLLANPRDLVAARRTINTPRRGIGAVTQDAFFCWVQQEARRAEQLGHVAPTLLDHLHAIVLLSDDDENDTDEEDEGEDDRGEKEEVDGDVDFFDVAHHDSFSEESSSGREDISTIDSDSDSYGGNNSDSHWDDASDDTDFDFSLHQELANNCPLSRRELNVMSKYASLMTKFDQYARRHSLTDLTHHVVASLRLGEHVKKMSKDANDERDRWENVQELLKGTVKYSNHSSTSEYDSDEEGVERTVLSAAACRKSLVQFMEHVSLFSGDDGSGCTLVNGEEDGGGKELKEEEVPVQLMTIHSSKGLEFDVVILSGAEEGCLPLLHRPDSNSSLDQEEERRLAYVAMTRAKSSLVITHRRRTLLLTRGSNNTHKLTSRKAKMSRFLFPLKKMNREDYCTFVDRSGDGGEARKKKQGC